MRTDDPLEQLIGSFGRYQTILLVFMAVGRMPTDIQLQNVVFILPEVSYLCKDNQNLNLTNTCPCSSPDYDRSVMVDSATSEWNLICERKSLASLAQSMMHAGIFTGSLFYGYISDRFGRRKAALTAYISMPIFGTISALVPEYWMFAVLKFFIGTTLGGALLCSFVLLVEFSGSTIRPFIVGTYEWAHVVSTLLFPVIAYNVREWRLLQLATTSPFLVTILYYWFLPESPRWLITAGKRKEAIDAISKIITVNKRNTMDLVESFVDEMIKTSQAATSERHRSSYLDLFKTPKIRIYTIVSAFMWMCCCLVFFGMSQYLGRVQGNIYFNIFLYGLLQIPGLVIVGLGSRYIGRKSMVIFIFASCSLTCLAFMLIPKEWNKTASALAVIGYAEAFVSFILLYLYTSEIFPTVIRNSAMGFSSMSGRVGGFIAPFIANINTGWVSVLVFSVTSFCAVILCCFLPETKNTVLLNTIDQTEQTEKQTNKAV